jgi:long-chain fatty acid transport protein
MRNTPILSLAAVCLCLVAPPPGLTTNGLNMIGGNVRSSGLGGAGVALDQDCSGAICNPAGFGKLGPRSFSAGSSFMLPRVALRNTVYGPNDGTSDSHIYPMPYVAYAQRLGSRSPWTIGFTFCVQGGMGVDFANIRTLADTVDEISTNIQFARLNPTVSYQVNERFTVGAAAAIGYVWANLRLLPKTYSPGADGTPGTMDDFAGLRIEDLSSAGLTGRFGLQYRVAQRLTLGFTFTPETKLELGKGNLRMNFGILEAGYDAEMVNFAWPQETVFGVAVVPTPWLILAADVKRVGWASAMDEVEVKGSHPDMSLLPPQLEIVFRMKWKDQWVYAVGAECAVRSSHVVRVGYNYGKSPVPDQYVLPLFPATAEHHATAGYTLTADHWRIEMTVEHSFGHWQRNANPNLAENPFGPGTQIRTNPGYVLHPAIAYLF